MFEKCEGCDYFRIYEDLTYCTHPNNEKDEEGNTTKELCPLEGVR